MRLVVFGPWIGIASVVRVILTFSRTHVAFSETLGEFARGFQTLSEGFQTLRESHQTLDEAMQEFAEGSLEAQQLTAVTIGIQGDRIEELENQAAAPSGMAVPSGMIATFDAIEVCPDGWSRFVPEVASPVQVTAIRPLNLCRKD